jgi:chromosome segregation ATPase
MEIREDKLRNIKEEWTAVGDISGGDVNWLIAENERLRGQLKYHEDLKRAVDEAANKISEIKAARIADLEALLDQAKRSVQALGGFDPNIPAHGALRLITHSIKLRLTALCYGAEGVIKDD